MQVSSGLQAGGLERVVVNLANALADMGYNSYILCSRVGGELTNDIHNNVHAWCSRRKWRWDLTGIHKIASYIDAHKIDIVHTHNHHSSYLLRIVLRFCDHKSLHIVHDHHGPALHDRKMSFYDWIFLRGVDAYIAVTEELQKRAVKLLNFSEERCLFIPNGIEIFDRHDYWGGRPTVIQVANLKWPKNHVLAMHVAAIVRKSIPNLNWICVGRIADPPDNYIKDVRQLISSLDLATSVTLLGARSDVRALLRQANVGVLTSDSEGLPISLLEYMAEQLPVVVTSVGQCPAIVREFQSGIIVPPGNAGEFAKSLVELLRDSVRARELGNNGRACVAKYFSVEVMTQKIISLYNTLLDTKSH
jgi:glycosyltransferase involved in cell wall biosynthesis